MSLARRWLDPIRSRWFFSRSYRQRHLSARNGITVYLRLDDAYSYLLVQLLPQLDDLLVDKLGPLRINICEQPCPPPAGMSVTQWQQYMLADAAALAEHHRFTFDATARLPTTPLMQQATAILKASPLRGNDYLHLLQDIFHMLWQHQQGKLNTLYYMASRRQPAPSVSTDPPAIQFVDQCISSAYLLFGGRQYRAIDDFLRLTRRLKQQKLLNSEPIFLINHIEWGEHLVNDPESLTEIQALHAQLDIYVALEDPISWLILDYLKRELVDYYNLCLKVHPLPYQGRDAFDWGLIARLSRRTEVAIAPFCRPDALAALNIARLIYAVEEDQRAAALLEVLRGVWTKGLDAGFSVHLQQLAKVALTDNQHLIDADETRSWLQDNQAICQTYHQPDLPIMILKIGENQHVFNSLYRIWRIESLLADALETE